MDRTGDLADQNFDASPTSDLAMAAFGERFATAHDVMCVRAAAYAARWAAAANADANATFAKRVADEFLHLDPAAYASVADLRVAARSILARASSNETVEARAELAAVIEAI
jgi:hypothetical protein